MSRDLPDGWTTVDPAVLRHAREQARAALADEERAVRRLTAYYCSDGNTRGPRSLRSALTTPTRSRPATCQR
jgi:hypothetical protein